ncbi:MAG: metal-sensitive transcriptional regulator [Candidatus Taylorbacteria bacterium]|nr:metal-sensitive transcriptional regulator [Candidatus Taylorbacteria bacterium]
MREDIKKRATRRLKIINGQIRGLEKMVEEEKYCIDIITQTEAIREALSSVRDLILQNHLLTHLTHQMQNGEEKKATNEMMKVYKLIGKK